MPELTRRQVEVTSAFGFHLPAGAAGLLGLGIPNLAKRLSQVEVLSSIASRPLSSATSVLAVSMSDCVFIWGCSISSYGFPACLRRVR